MAVSRTHEYNINTENQNVTHIKNGNQQLIRRTTDWIVWTGDTVQCCFIPGRDPANIKLIRPSVKAPGDTHSVLAAGTRNYRVTSFLTHDTEEKISLKESSGFTSDTTGKEKKRKKNSHNEKAWNEIRATPVNELTETKIQTCQQRRCIDKRNVKKLSQDYAFNTYSGFMHSWTELNKGRN